MPLKPDANMKGVLKRLFDADSGRFLPFQVCLQYSPSRLGVTGGTQRVCRFVPQMSRPVINPETAEQDAACFEKDLDCSPLNGSWFIFGALHQIVGLLSWKQAYAFFSYTCLEVLVPI